VSTRPGITQCARRYAPPLNPFPDASYSAFTGRKPPSASSTRSALGTASVVFCSARSDSVMDRCGPSAVRWTYSPHGRNLEGDGGGRPRGSIGEGADGEPPGEMHGELEESRARSGELQRWPGMTVGS
jgi:hypothetical protein